jgi:hypothetical protein
VVLEDAVDVLTTVVLGQMLDKFAVDANRSSNNGHDILSKGTGLVCADDGGVGCSLARIEDTNENVLLGHALSGKQESKSDGERETIRDSDYDQCNRNDEDLYECQGLDVRGTVHLTSNTRVNAE